MDVSVEHHHLTVEVLEGAGYAGWDVLAQDTVLTEEPRGEGPRADVRPAIDFLTSGGSALPSHVTPNGTGAAVLVTLQPGDSARSQVRFSPDVDPCDSGTATTLRVTMSAGGSFNVNIDPATRLCGGGSLQPTNFSGAD